jgi:cytochrome c
LRKLLQTIGFGGFVLIAVGSLLIHPFGPVKAARSEGPLLAGATVDPAVERILERSCQSCHSERTEWPWYSYVAPMSWMIESDVSSGRGHMNLSRWNEYSLEEKEERLSQMAALVRNRVMPLPRYLMLHREARLSDPEIALVNEWCRAERKRVRSMRGNGAITSSGATQ